jgi:hypothetical protein
MKCNIDRLFIACFVVLKRLHCRLQLNSAEVVGVGAILDAIRLKDY